MEPDALLNRLRETYARGDDCATTDLAAKAWPGLQALTPTQELGLICTYARLACYRQGRYAEGDIWWRRGFEQWRSSGYLGGMAILLITPALRSLAFADARNNSGLASVAKMILKVAGSIAETSEIIEDISIYTAPGLLRHVHEHLGYAFLREGRYSDALREYDLALSQVTRLTADAFPFQKKRALLQVSLGRALAAMFHESRRDKGIQALRTIIEEARGNDRFKDIHDRSVALLAAIESRPDPVFEDLREHFPI